MKTDKTITARIAWLIIAACASSAVPAAGQSPPVSEASPADHADSARPQAIRLGWADIVALVDQHPEVAASRHELDAAQADVDAAGAAPNPSIEATVGYGLAVDGSQSRVEWGLALSIPLGWLAQRRPRVDLADAGARAVEAESESLRRDVILQLRVLFWQLVYEQERVAALSQLNAETQALAATVARRVEQGEVRPVEATRVEVEAEKIAGELAIAESALAARSGQLAAWLGAPPGQTVEAVADLTRLPATTTREQAVEHVGDGNPSMIAARARVEALEAGVAAERRQRVPSIALEAFTDHELDRRAYGVGLTVDLPLWNWNSSNIRRSESAAAAGRERLEALRLELVSTAIEYQSKCQAGADLAARYRDRILPRARSAVDLTERTYQLGEATVLEVIDARRTLLETRRLFLEVLVRAQEDCSSLYALIGEVSP